MGRGRTCFFCGAGQEGGGGQRDAGMEIEKREGLGPTCPVAPAALNIKFKLP